MAQNAGMLYEEKINKLLKANKVQRASFQGAGSDSNAPDSEFTAGGKEYKMEIKLDLAVDFGQGSLDYDLKKDKWILGGSKTPAADQMRVFLEAMGVPKHVNSKQGWGGLGPPRKFTVPLNRFKPADVKYDYATFTDKFITNIDSNIVSKYYAHKKTYYIQIGDGYGLYHMTTDVAGLGTTKFTPQLRLRIRLKRGGSSPIHNYRFTTALQVKSLPKSKIDLDDKDDFAAIVGRLRSS